MAHRSSSIIRTSTISGIVVRRHLSSSSSSLSLRRNHGLLCSVMQQPMSSEPQFFSTVHRSSSYYIQQQQQKYKQYNVDNAKIVVTNRQRVLVKWFSDKTPNSEEEKVVGEKESTTVEETTAEVNKETENVDPKDQRINELEGLVKSLNDRLLRSLAEQDNTRRIAQRDVSDAKQYAIKSFAKGMLDVADNLSRALQAVPSELINDKSTTESAEDTTSTTNESNTVLSTLYEGIEMTEHGLNKTFESNGLSKFCTVDDVFDPNIHNALFEYPDATKTSGTIGQIIKSGYKLNNRILRPAEVGVIKN